MFTNLIYFGVVINSIYVLNKENDEKIRKMCGGCCCLLIFQSRQHPTIYKPFRFSCESSSSSSLPNYVTSKNTQFYYFFLFTFIWSPSPTCFYCRWMWNEPRVPFMVANGAANQVALVVPHRRQCRPRAVTTLDPPPYLEFPTLSAHRTLLQKLQLSA